MKTIKVLLMSVFIFLTFAIGAMAQTTIISPTGDGGFETGTTFAANGWTVVNAGGNNWQVGTATDNGGTRGAYVSNDGGTTNAYTINLSRTSHFYRDIAFPSGETIITLSFSWKNAGEGGYDRLLVYTAPTSVTPMVNSPASDATTLTGATLISGTGLHTQNTYTTFTATLPASFAGTTQRIIFTWQNDDTVGVQPPAAVDNISLVSQAPVPLSGTKTVCAAGCDYNSLTNAGGVFAALNTFGANGDVIISIAGDSLAETGLNALDQIGAGNTVTIRPSGAARTISGAAASTALIRTNGAGNITIDGSLSGGTDRSLTISNTATTTPTVIRFGSVGTTPFSDVTLKNCIVINGTNTGSAITVTDTGGSTSAYYNNLTIRNNDVRRAFRGIFVNAFAGGTNGGGTLITENTMNTSGTNSIRLNPIFVAGANGVSVTNNTLGNISDPNAEVPVGIVLSTGTDNAVVSGNTISGIVSSSSSSSGSASGILVSVGTGSTSINVSNNTISTITSAGTSVSHYGIASFSPNVGITGNTISGMTQTGATASFGIVLAGVSNNIVSQNTVSAMTSTASNVTSGIQVQGASTNVTFERNRVFNIKNTNTSGYGSNGIQLSSSSATANVTVRNNFVYDVAARGYTSGAGAADNGYGIIVTAGAGYNIWNNSVHLNTNQTQNGLPAAFNVTNGVTAAGAINLRNNIFANTQTVSTQRYSIYSGAANTVFSAIDYNDYFTTGPNLGYIVSNRATLADIVTGFGGNANSKNVNPLFVSATDLHLQATSTLLGMGVAIGGVTADYDNDTRDTVPDIGADEVVQGTGGMLAAGTYYNASPAAGTTFGGDITVTNSLTLNGIVDAGSNTLTLDCNAAVTGAGTSNFVVGNIRKNFCSTGTFTYPVGDNDGTAEYSPVTANITALGTSPSALTVNVVDVVLPGLNPALAATRYWNLTETGDLTANLTFQYVEADTSDINVNTDEDDYRIWRNNGGMLENKCPSAPCVNTTANTVTTPTAQTEFSPWGIGNLLAPSAAAVNVGGRVITQTGRGIAGARVRLIDGQGNIVIRQTNSTGYFRFNDIEGGQIYTLSVGHKTLTFAQPSQTIFVNDEYFGILFVATGQNQDISDLPPDIPEKK